MLVTQQTLQKRRFFMSNQMITTTNNTVQMTLFPEAQEKTPKED